MRAYHIEGVITHISCRCSTGSELRNFFHHILSILKCDEKNFLKIFKKITLTINKY